MSDTMTPTAEARTPAIVTERNRRIFRFGGMNLEDPDPAMTPEQVKKVYAEAYPKLTNGAVTGPEVKDGQEIYTFKEAVGTKG